MSKALSGHQGVGGVQKHSCGDIFPWTIVIKGNTQCGSLYAMNGETGARDKPYNYNSREGFEMAHEMAEMFAGPKPKVRRVCRSNKPLYWILRHKEDGRVLCVDGNRRSMASGIERIKKYKTEGFALRRAKFDYVCHAVHPGDGLDCCGRIYGRDGGVR